MKQNILLFILLFFLVTSKSQNRYALVIGNANYSNSPLKNPINDATSVSEVLKKLKFDVITVKDGDIISMQRALNEFNAKIIKDPGAVRLFYYSGHGSQLEGKNYLLPINTTFQDAVDFKYNNLCVDLVIDKMKTNDPNSINIIILDACRTNPLMKGFSREAKQGLTRVQAPTNSIVCFATLEDQTASDNTNGQNGLFTQELLKNIQAENIELTKVFKLVSKSVNELSNFAQQPAIYSSMNDDFYFIGDGTGAPIIYKPIEPIVENKTNELIDQQIDSKKRPCEINKTSTICFSNKYSASLELLCYTTDLNNNKKGLEKLVIPSNNISCYYDIPGNIINYEVYKMGSWGIPEKIYSSNSKLINCEEKNIILSPDGQNLSNMNSSNVNESALKTPCELNNTSSICFKNNYTNSVKALCYTMDINGNRTSLNYLIIPAGGSSCYYDIKGNVISYQIYNIDPNGYLLGEVLNSSTRLINCKETSVVINPKTETKQYQNNGGVASPPHILKFNP